MSIVSPKIRLKLANLPPHLTNKCEGLPLGPGCYLFKNQSGKIIYIGKAKNIKKRVRTYWQKNQDIKTSKLVDEIADVNFIVTDNEVEALLLEAKLIKENYPKYNIELKGGVRYAYIKITNEQLPRLETVRFFKRQDVVFGPFTSGQARKDLIGLANELFKLRTSKRKPVKVGNMYRIYCSVHPWLRFVTEDDYQRDIEKAKLLLSGKMNSLIEKLNQEMKKYSGQQFYELAKLRRDQIRAVESAAERQKIQLKKSYDQDVINYSRSVNTFFVQLFNINKGVVSGRKQFKFSVSKIATLDSAAVADFITQYYYSNEIPQEIILPVAPDDKAALIKYLAKLTNRKVRIIIPQRGDKLSLLDLVKKNILSLQRRGDSALFELQEKLSLPKLPSVIECFDVSNLGSSQIVGSMVYFKDGAPNKNNYRRFKIKYQRGQSDFDAMKEIIYRRYQRLQIEAAPLPNLVLVDGGKPQLSAARAVFRQLGLNLPVVALAKKQEELFLPGKDFPIRLTRKSDALKMVQKIRDEAHRFAIKYHRLLRSKTINKSRN